MRGWLDALRVGPMRSRRSAVSVLLPVVLLTEASGICVHTEVQACWFSKVLHGDRHTRDTRHGHTRHGQGDTRSATCTQRTGLRSGGGRTRTNKKINRATLFQVSFTRTRNAMKRVVHPPRGIRRRCERYGMHKIKPRREIRLFSLSLHARGRMKHVPRTYNLLYICVLSQ